jgi:hypothetical protein
VRRAAGRGDGQDDAGVEHVGVVGGGAGAGLDHLVQQHGQVLRRQVPYGQAGLVRPDGDAAGAGAVEQAAGAAGLLAGVPSRPPLQSSTTSSGRPPRPDRQAARVAVNQPAHSRIIRFVLPLPVEPTMTMCRAHAAGSRVNTGCHGWPIARMVAPTGIRPPLASRGTAPGAWVRPWAVRTCRFHWRLSKMTGG